MFQPGEDFRVAQQKAAERAQAKEQAELYSDVAALPKVDMSNSEAIPDAVVTEGQEFAPEYEPTPEQLAEEAAAAATAEAADADKEPVGA